jgi:isopenicillin N synthase-like dioxygenase
LLHWVTVSTKGFEVGPEYDVHCDDLTYTNQHAINVCEKNIWPEETDLPNFRKEMMAAYYNVMHLGDIMLQLVAISIGQEADFFRPLYCRAPATFRLLHYPPPKEDSDVAKCSKALTVDQELKQEFNAEAEKAIPLGCGAHTDTDMLTLLMQDDIGGLEVLNADKQWISGRPLPGSIVCNIGDVVSKWTGGKYVATFHRVRITKPVERFSIAMFFEPNFDASMLPVVDVSDKENYKNENYVQYMMDKVKREFVEYQLKEA